MMLRRSVTLFKIFGFKIKVDLIWIILAGLIAWCLAKGWFPEFHKDLPPSAYWLMGIAGSLGLFLSIVLHELIHCLMARHYGMFIKSITLFMFGGVPESEDDPPSWTAEFWVALVGPVTSVALSGLMYLFQWGGHILDWPVTVTGVFYYLTWLNFVLAAFHLAPAFPLDGGRILRSILWFWKKDLGRATEIAVNTGYGFGVVLIGIGIYFLIMGSFAGWLWWLMIGVFVWLAARGSYRQTLEHNIFHKIKVRDIMVRDPVVLSRSMSLEKFIYDYVYQDHVNLYPVVSFGKFVGCVTVSGASRVPREELASHTVGSVTEPCSPDTSVNPDESAEKAMFIMNKTGYHRLLVVDGEQLIGVVAREDMLNLLTLKTELKSSKETGNDFG